MEHPQKSHYFFFFQFMKHLLEEASLQNTSVCWPSELNGQPADPHSADHTVGTPPPSASPPHTHTPPSHLPHPHPPKQTLPVHSQT